ncbi:MAG: response regulator [Desulfuromonadales bacterium]|nr:response regulator [Desulfuromonadales bacterium]
MEHGILHIEDDSTLANLVKMAFESFGYRGNMLSACSISEGLATLEECARNQRPLDLILVDMHLPDGMGLDIIKVVKADSAWRLTPVIVLSGENSSRVINNAYAIGANCFLPKIGKTKSTLRTLRSLYDCWIDSAMLPQVTSDGNHIQANLSRGIRFRARTAMVYMDLSQAFSSDPSQAEFWLNRALNEGNFSNLLVFLQRILNEHDMPEDVNARFLQMQVQTETSLFAAEQFLKHCCHPTIDDSLAKVLDILEALDEKLLAEIIGHVFPRNQVLAKTFQSAVVDHCTKMAAFITERTELPGLHARASALRAVANELNVTCPS